jgi:rod shape-determining protein MreC
LRAFFEKYGLKLLLAVTAAAVLLSVLSYVSATSSFLHNAAGAVLSPFRAAASAVVGWVEDKQQYYKDYSDLVAENEALRARVAELERGERQAEADSNENALLRSLLGLREQRRDFVFESASVTERNSTNWAATLTLNRGTEHGVDEGDCVVSAEGYLVGVVDAVGSTWCRVLTVTDTDTEIGARVFRTNEIAVAEGDLSLMGEGKLKLSYLSGDSGLISGDYVLTSGLGGFYPGALAIGTVDSVQTDDDGLARYAVITPLAQLDELTQVFIIKDFDIVD